MYTFAICNTSVVRIWSGGGPVGHILFHEICSIANVYDAWREFRSGKTKKRDIQQFELKLETELFAIHTKLSTKTFIPHPYQDFFIKDPKLRHIHKAVVRDRVVHQALFRILYPIVDTALSPAVYSARNDLGTHKGVKDLFVALRKVSQNWNREVWVLKIDIRKFFDCIDHSILKEKIRQFYFDSETTNLITVLIDSFEKSNAKGLPLGNVTSQLFANIYLNDFDWFIKQELQIQHYFRYCDDMVLILENKAHALVLLSRIQRYLQEKLLLTVHPQKIYVRKVRQGIDFLGYVILPHAVILRTKTKTRVYKKIQNIHKKKGDRKAIIDSYLGVSTYAKSRVLTKHLLSNKALLG